jgi:hypothetical protein
MIKIYDNCGVLKKWVYTGQVMIKKGLTGDYLGRITVRTRKSYNKIAGIYDKIRLQFSGWDLLKNQ